MSHESTEDILKISFRCPVCSELIEIKVSKASLDNAPAGVLTLPILHEHESFGPHLIVISVDPHGFVRSGYLYRHLIKVSRGEILELQRRLGGQLMQCASDAHQLVFSGKFDPVKDIDRIIETFRFKYKEDIFMTIIGRMISLRILERERKILSKYRGLESLIDKIIIPVLKKIKVNARCYPGLRDTVEILSSSFSLEFILGFIDGILMKIKETAKMDYRVIPESLNPPLIRICKVGVSIP